MYLYYIIFLIEKSTYRITTDPERRFRLDFWIT